MVSQEGPKWPIVMKHGDQQVMMYSIRILLYTALVYACRVCRYFEIAASAHPELPMRQVHWGMHPAHHLFKLAL